MLPAQFEAIVREHPDEVAVVYGDRSLCYRELNARANQLGHFLRRKGVGPETLVGVCMERTPLMVVALLGILKAGGAYVPLDPEYPHERLAYMLKDSGLKVLLATEESAGNLPAFELGLLDTVLLDADWPNIVAYPAADLLLPTCPGQLAYVMYTSGSTGEPKAVGITRESILRLVRDSNYIDFATRPRIAQAANFSFDAATFELWGALLNGGSVCIVDKDVLLDPPAFVQLVARQKIDTLFLTTALFNLYAHSDSGVPAGLKCVLFGGEQADAGSVRRARERSPTQKLLHVYGVTESTTFSSWFEINSLPEAASSVAIGRPVTGTSAYVMDSWGSLAQIGAVGELYIGGEGLARGYLGRPGLTAQRFVPDPFARSAGARLYRTGDLVRWRADGVLEFVGRADRQLKIRGMRIEPGEIETVLLSIDGVREAVVTAWQSDGTKHLVAYVVTSDKEPITEKLRAHLKQTLPEHMVPAYYVCLESLPLNENGKVDRERLPAPQEDALGRRSSYAPPRNETEAALTRIWQTELSVDRVGIEDNFFELGGDSLLALTVKAQAQQCGIDFDLAALFSHQTIAALAAVAKPSEAKLAPQTRPFVLISAEDAARLPATVTDAYPLSQLQMGMLFHSDFEAGSTLYHIVIAFKVQMTFDASALREALEVLAERHEILRTSIDADSFSEPLQLVHARAVIPLMVTDLRGLSASEQHRQQQTWLRETVRQPFDTKRPPLLQVFVQQLSDSTSQLALRFHHAIMDGWSDASFVTELLQLYQAHLQGDELRLEPLKVRYSDYIALEQQALQSQDSRDFWVGLLNGMQVTQLHGGSRNTAADAVSKETGTTCLESVRIPILQRTSDGLNALAARAATPLKTVLLAAHMQALSVLSGSLDVSSGLVTNGRPEVPDGDRALGLFLNTVPFRIRLGNDSPLDLIARVFASECDCMPHRRYPLPEIMRQISARPIIQVAFNYTHFHVYEQLGDLKQKILSDGGQGESSIPLQLQFFQGNSGVVGEIIGHRAFYDRAALERFADCYRRVLALMADKPDLPMKRIELLEQLPDHMAPHRATRRSYSQEKLIHELFEEQVDRTPEAVAVVYEGHSLSYAQLDARANRLAGYLRAKGVGPDRLVGICVERSLEMVVGLLGTLKAGGAYVPLDPTYPAERLQYMLSDAAPTVLLTQTCLRERLPHSAAEVIALDEQGGELAQQSAGRLDARTLGLKSHHLAYVIYTSGSTGKPKGVMVEHRNVTRLFAATQAWFNFNERDVWTLFHSFAFDFSVWEVWGALLHGGQVVVVPYLIARSPLEFYRLVCEKGVTVLNQTPSAFTQLIEAQAHSAGKQHSLRVVIFGGEALELRALRPWVRRNGAEQPQLVNMYGITETTVHVTYRPLTREEIESESSSLIGKPIPDLQVYLLDPHAQLVPVAVQGEIYVGGAGVARGYLNRPELTAERFVRDPFSADPQARMYKTGDLGKWRPDGALEYLGRNDHQVKIRGFRIEPGEIEAQLLRHPDVKEAVVLAREDSPGEKRLVAYLVARSSVTKETLLSAKALRAYLKPVLPDYMVPSAFVTLKSFPLSPHGKLDRARLPRPEENRAATPELEMPPRTGNERTLATIWRSVLGRERAGIHDDFFASGGSSLTAWLLMVRIQKHFAIRLPVAAIFANPTIAMLAALLESMPVDTNMQRAVRLTNDNARSPALFLIPPGGGDSLCYRELLSEIAGRAPVVGFEHAGPFAPDLPRPMSMERLAASYRISLRSVQPKGPYYLAGWSLGGLLAYEIAAQLEQQDEEVALLVVIDSVFPAMPPQDSASLDLQLHQVLQETDAGAQDRLLETLESRDDVASHLRAVLGDPAGANVEVHERLRFYRRMHLVHLIAQRLYQPNTTVSNLCYISAQQESGVPRAPSVDRLRQLTRGRFHSHCIDADHDSLLRAPAVREVIAHLNAEVGDWLA